MIKMIKEKFSILLRRLTDTFPSCLLVMTKGNLQSLNLGHFGAAIKTAMISGVIMVFISFFEPKKWLHNKYTIGALTGFSTIISDYISHPSSFSGEAVVTGFCAMILCILFSSVVKN